MSRCEYRDRLARGLLSLPLVLVGACESRARDTTAAPSSSPGASEAAALPVTEPQPVSYQGVDVSHYQGDVDWSSVKAAGIQFAFAKATEGASEVDPKFDANWAALKKADLIRGAYHFFSPDVDAAAQAKHFIATVQLEAGDLAPALDVELDEGVSVSEIQDEVRVWLEAVAKAYGIQPILYSDLSFLSRELAHGFDAYPLWIADYRETAPEAPGDWDSWALWQYSQSGSVAGIDGAVDRDVYRGTLAGWSQLMLPLSPE